MTANPSPRAPRRPSRRRRAAALTALLSVLGPAAFAAGTGPAVGAAGTPVTERGRDGQELSVSVTKGLDPSGQAVRVTGKGYDESKGIYVALCKDNGPGRVPSPCAGGADMSGGSKASAWIVPRGDAYEGDLATGYGVGGTFDVELHLKAVSTGLDCKRVRCSVVTRVDHRGAGDRTQDVRVPVAFAAAPPPGGIGVDVPEGTVSYRESAQFTTAGKPLDLLVHPESGKLYVGADNLPDTADVDERGLYVLDPADGRVRSHISQAPGANGLRTSAVARMVAPLPGDGVRFQYPLRGIGSATDGDRTARGVWLAGSTVTDVGPGTSSPTAVLVAQGNRLSEVDSGTGTVLRELTLPGGSRFAVDPTRRHAWFVDFDAGRLYQIETVNLTVRRSVDLPVPVNGTSGFVEVDPESGDVWLGSGRTVLVFDPDGRLATTLDGPDHAIAVTFDGATDRAFLVRQDGGDLAEPGNDNDGSLTVYDTEEYERRAEPVALPGLHGQLGAAAVAVAPGGAAVYVTHPVEGKVVKLVRRTSPKVTASPTDLRVEPGEDVRLTARAEGAPEPTVRWQTSTDGGTAWSTVPGADDDTLAFTATRSQDGHRFRAEYSNSAGTTRTRPMTLTVAEEEPTTSGGTSGAHTGGGSTGGTTTGGGSVGGAAAGGVTGGGNVGGTEGSDTTGGGASGGTAGGGSAGGSDGGGGAATGGSDPAGDGSGALASTGTTVLSAAAAAAALLAAGAALVRRRRPGRAPAPGQQASRG
ncbi:immunoglobulin domain-containing protein [Streptomyces sp. NPDC002490]|uniref:immunoglobulin domain-containing protein n=1 Tax=Streptomyces sp. NPDC002490 TaxID=3154416 RepID=UPI0033331720